MCHWGEHSDPSTAGASKWAHHTGWREYKRSIREHQHVAAPGLQKQNTRGSIKMRENTTLSHILEQLKLDLFLTSRGYSVHYRAELPFPLLRQASLAKSLEMCLHGGIHGQEIALKEAAECSGGHFSDLHNKWGGDEKLKYIVRPQFTNYFQCTLSWSKWAHRLKSWFICNLLRLTYWREKASNRKTNADNAQH